jgi:branched-chain amino acid aminotransferase
MKPLHVWMDGEVCVGGQCSVMEHGLHYGTGVFEGIRAYPTAKGVGVFRLKEHLERMDRGANCLGMDFDSKAVHEAIGQLITLNEQRSAYVRPIAFFGGGSLHLDVDNLLTRVVVATLPWRSHLGEASEEKGVTLGVSAMQRNSRSAIPNLKLCGGYVNSILAKRAASMAGFEEALFVDEQGMVCEATGENVFAVFGDQVVAVKHPDALPGITRNSVLELSGGREAEMSLAELESADEIFLTGTSAEVAPVTRLGERELGIGSITRDIQQTYQDVVHGRSDAYSDWLTIVN